MIVNIPFCEDFRLAMLTGRKTATSRTKRYGAGGDRFRAFGAWFTILDVQTLRLETIACEHYAAEGFDSPEAFRSVWIALHPRRGWQAEQAVWFHEFKRMSMRLYAAGENRHRNPHSREK